MIEENYFPHTLFHKRENCDFCKKFLFMNKTTVFRRIIGIIALVCWAVTFVPWIVLPDGDRLAWQLQNWAMASSSILTIVYIIVLTVQYNKDEQKTLMRIRNMINCCVTVTICVAFFIFAALKADHKIWENEKYVIYGYKVNDDINGGFCIPTIFDFYERKGIVDDRLGIIGDMRAYLFNTGDLNRVRKIDYTIYEPLDLIKEEMDYMPNDTDSVRHLVSFYRLSDLSYCYDQSQNDSHIELTSQ